MPVSESEQKAAEHIPFKKRRFLFRASSPPRNTTIEAAERHETNPISNQLNSVPSFLPQAVARTNQRGSNDDKLDEKEPVKEDDVFFGISILAAEACSNSLSDRCEVKQDNSKSGNEESTTTKKEEFTFNNSSSQAPLESTVSKNQEENTNHKSSVRLNWDLNTVMDAWDEPFVEEKKNDCNPSVPVETKSLLNENELKVGDHKPYSVNDVIPVTRTPPTFSKWASPAGKSSGGLNRMEAVDTQLSMNCSVPPGFDHCLNLRASKENIATLTCKYEIIAQQKVAIPIKVDENEAKVKTELVSDLVPMEDLVSKETKLVLQETNEVGLKEVKHETTIDAVVEDQPAVISSMNEAQNSQSDNRAGSTIDKLEGSVGYDSRYEDGELRESSIHEGEIEYVMDNMGDDINPGVIDNNTNETGYECGKEGSSGVKVNEIESGKEADLITSDVMLPEISGSGPTEIISGEEKSEKQESVQQHGNQSDEWKMNVSGWDVLPQNQRTNDFTKTRSFSGRKFSYREQKDEVENKDEGPRFYRKESREVFLSRDRFRMKGCSSKAGDGLTSRPERESGVVRSFGPGRYSPPHNRGGGMWNRSPERRRELKRLHSPNYQNSSFHRNILEDSGSLDNITNEGGMDPTRRSFRSRSPLNREANDFRARLGLRPTGDNTSHDRFIYPGRGRGRGRSIRYVDPPMGRYPASDECDEFSTEYLHPLRRRRCFSPIERRGINYTHHQSHSRSPTRPETRSPITRRRSRSPNRIRRPRSPNYRRGFEPDHEYNNNSSPPSSRWEGAVVFDRRSPPQRERERFNFTRKPKQNEYYRSGHPGRFSDLNEGGSGRGRPRYMGGSNEGDRPNNGYRPRGGFVRRYNGRGFDARDKQALELHARGNLKQQPCTDGTDTRFRDFPREVKEQAITTTTNNNVDLTPNA